MSAIDTSTLNAINGRAASAASYGTDADDLQDSFMTLLVTQLRNQDPMNPMENAEMTSQLAQINTVSGIKELNTTLEAITGQLDAGQAIQAAGLIGKGVLVPGERILMGEDGSSTPFGIELGGAAEEVRITIRNGNGEVVRRFDPFAMDAGVESFTWNGEMDDGEIAPKGAYSVSVEATADGEDVPVTQLNYALVNGVSLDPQGAPRLDLGGISEPVKLADIRQIL
ncbi:flagellar hook assembly protein FlgD [Alloalcanivorax gelatiniphagus]|uniref:Basal-body rod modification protein FlgD n=1 Tax=Alloalcanivorax gelatiniphagus TaxID=1194167 RepID=A0ABY2XHE3_9GAMM|nr:flagellar hook assembly protein FlgD [Alloalcanivorax gelatiniphagus]TMW10463.1 flagellar hook assembly protein FlgD [Alloalcanivorax gelatiniphagus]|tara:strand:- start:2108 stop:2785 length:678 start_codon:yes stop_codon:yes gene_type:complete